MDSLEDCTAVPHKGIDAALCTTATVTIPASDLEESAHDVAFQNPESAACKSDPEEDGVMLQIVGIPEITAAEPSLICTDDRERSLSLKGANFFSVDGVTPTVTVDGVAVTVVGIDGCTDVDVVGIEVQNCSEINISVPQGAFSQGNPEFTVTNPSPIGCSSTSTALTIPPTVVIDSITPSVVCETNAGVSDLDVAGAGFLRINGADPVVIFDGVTVSPTDFTGCASLQVAGLMVEACTGFSINVDLTGAAIGAKELTVTNAEPSGCAATATDLFHISGPPNILSVMPTNICGDVPETITISGTDFAMGAIVDAGGTVASMVTVSADGTSITATFANGLAPGTYDVTVNNGGCGDTFLAER